MKIMKRSGIEADFDVTKISAAIKKANCEVAAVDQLSEEQIGFNKYFIVEGREASLMFFEGDLLSVSIPEKVELTVAKTDPAIKGAPSNQTKDAVTNTGLTLRVPQFIEEGEEIVVFSSDGKYAGRA